MISIQKDSRRILYLHISIASVLSYLLWEKALEIRNFPQECKQFKHYSKVHVLIEQKLQSLTVTCIWFVGKKRLGILDKWTYVCNFFYIAHAPPFLRKISFLILYFWGSFNTDKHITHDLNNSLFNLAN